mgnify:CR=1 FL=1
MPKRSKNTELQARYRATLKEKNLVKFAVVIPDTEDARESIKRSAKRLRGKDDNA